MIEDMINTIICGDCLEVMRGLPDGCVDLVLADPPYGIGADAIMHKQGGTQYGRAAAPKRHYADTNWDRRPLTKEQAAEIFRVSRNQIIFGGNHFASLLPPSPCWLVWDKLNGGNGFADCELVFTSFATAVRKFPYLWNGMLQENMACKEPRFHPTQKPVGLVVQFIERFTSPNDLILDPFSGSGTTAVACICTGRRFIGIEISEEYCQIARDRISAEQQGLTVAEVKRGQLSLLEATNG